ncbi:MAG: ParA family protein [Planctomycetota bacterium]|nr:ParA family protein [Planctomycetota bacterium]
MKSLVLFNNKAGVGKTTLTFHIAHLLSRNGSRIVVLDFDPQSKVTAIFLDEEHLEDIWSNDVGDGRTVAGCLDLVRRGKGELRDPQLVMPADNLWLLPGSLFLSRFEQTLAEEWAKTGSTQNERALDVTCSLANLAERAAEAINADYLLVDVGSSLGALNRAALLCCDAVIIPVAPDLFSLQGLRNIGPTLREWRVDWQTVLNQVRRKADRAPLPEREFRPLGYIVQQHLARSDRPMSGYRKWAEQVPSEFRHCVLDEASSVPPTLMDDDPYCIARLKHFASLVPIAQAARKPMFDLRQADGIAGGQLLSVKRCREEFERLVAGVTQRLEQTVDASGLTC